MNEWRTAVNPTPDKQCWDVKLSLRNHDGVWISIVMASELAELVARDLLATAQETRLRIAPPPRQ